MRVKEIGVINGFDTNIKSFSRSLAKTQAGNHSDRHIELSALLIQSVLEYVAFSGKIKNDDRTYDTAYDILKNNTVKSVGELFAGELESYNEFYMRSGILTDNVYEHVTQAFKALLDQLEEL